MPKLESIFSEAELLSYLNLTKQQLTDLREEGLRYIRVNRNVRLYSEDSIIAFLKSRETRRTVQHRVQRESP